MALWKKIALWSLAVWITGFGIGIGTGAVGVCGSGNLFGVAAFICGLIAMPVLFVSLVVGIADFVLRKRNL
jgi:hypothetical protein